MCMQRHITGMIRDFCDRIGGCVLKKSVDLASDVFCRSGLERAELCDLFEHGTVDHPRVI